MIARSVAVVIEIINKFWNKSDSFEENFSKFLTLNLHSQAIILSYVGGRSFAIEEKLRLFNCLDIQKQSAVFSFLSRDVRIYIWRNFPSDLLNQMIPYDDFVNAIKELWNLIPFESNLAKFVTLSPISQVKVLQAVVPNMSSEQRLTFFNRMDIRAQIEIFNSIENLNWHNYFKGHIFNMWLGMDSALRKHVFVHIIQSTVVQCEFWERINSYSASSVYTNACLDLWLALSPAERISFIPQDMWVMEAG